MRRPHLIEPDHFGVVLTLLLALFVLIPLLQERRYGAIVLALVIFTVFVSTLAAVGLGSRAIAVGLGVGVLAAIAVIAGSVVSDQTIDEWMTALFAAVLAITTFLVLRRILQHRRVTLSTVAGALCAYLLVGMTFASLYRTISGVAPDAFSEPLGSAATYFSYVTLTTLGYGDITPVSQLARSLTTLEAIIGQVLLVTLVARFVSTMGQVRPPLVRRSEDQDPAGVSADR